MMKLKQSLTTMFEECNIFDLDLDVIKMINEHRILSHKLSFLDLCSLSEDWFAAGSAETLGHVLTVGEGREAGATVEHPDRGPGIHSEQ